MRVRSIGLFLASGLWLTSVSMRGRAATDEDKAAAEALFDAGRKAMAEHNYDEACPKLADSQRLDPGVGTLLNLALCYKESGKTASAWSTFREAAATAREQGQPEREAMARQEADQLERKLTRLKLVIGPAITAIEGLTISRDGKAIVKSLWTLAIPVDPGPHTLEASAPGRRTAKVDFDARGEGKTIEVTLPEPAAAGGPSSAPAASSAPSAVPGATPVPGAGAGQSGTGESVTGQTAANGGAEPRKRSPVLGYVLAGAGVVGLGVGIGYGLKARSKNEDALDICPDPNGPCSQADVARHANLVDSAESARGVAFVATGIGVAALGTGIVLILTASRSPSTAGGDRTGTGQSTAGGDRTGTGQATAGGDRTSRPSVTGFSQPRQAESAYPGPGDSQLTSVNRCEQADGGLCARAPDSTILTSSDVVIQGLSNRNPARPVAPASPD